MKQLLKEELNKWACTLPYFFGSPKILGKFLIFLWDILFAFSATSLTKLFFLCKWSHTLSQWALSCREPNSRWLTILEYARTAFQPTLDWAISLWYFYWRLDTQYTRWWPQEVFIFAWQENRWCYVPF